MQLAGFARLCQHGADSAINQSGDITQGEDASEQKKTKLDRISPNDGFDSANISVKQGQKDKKQYRPKNRITRASGEEIITQHQLYRDACHIHSDAGSQGLANQKKCGSRLTRSWTKR